MRLAASIWAACLLLVSIVVAAEPPAPAAQPQVRITLGAKGAVTVDGTAYPSARDAGDALRKLFRDRRTVGAAAWKAGDPVPAPAACEVSIVLGGGETYRDLLLAVAAVGGAGFQTLDLGGVVFLMPYDSVQVGKSLPRRPTAEELRIQPIAIDGPGDLAKIAAADSGGAMRGLLISVDAKMDTPATLVVAVLGAAKDRGAGLQLRCPYPLDKPPEGLSADPASAVLIIQADTNGSPGLTLRRPPNTVEKRPAPSKARPAKTDT
jgi:hypothetical protein